MFRIVEYGPGVAPRNHRTESIDDAVVMAGEIDMDIDGSTVHLRAGDVLVQRGTIHNWNNRGTEPCVIAFVLIAARRSSAPAACSRRRMRPGQGSRKREHGLCTAAPSHYVVGGLKEV